MLLTRFRGIQTPSILDLVITRLEQELSKIIVEEPLGKSDHAVIKGNFRIKFAKPPEKLKRSYHKINLEEMKLAAVKQIWIPNLENPSLEDRWKIIKNNLLHLTNEYVPYTKQRKRGKPIWWRSYIDKAMIRRRRSWFEYKQKKSQSMWDVYKNIVTKQELYNEKHRRNSN